MTSSVIRSNRACSGAIRGLLGRRDVFFHRDPAEVVPEGLDLARARLYRQIGRVQFPTVLFELDACVYFSWQLLGREPIDAQELLAVYAALLAAGPDLASRGIATMMRGVRESTVRRYMRLFEAEPALRAANEALVRFARTRPMVEYWDSGYAASSDLMSLDASTWKLQEVIDRRQRPGRAVPSDTILAHVAPVAFSQINFRAIYRFPIDQYLDQIPPSGGRRDAVNA